MRLIKKYTKRSPLTKNAQYFLRGVARLYLQKKMVYNSKVANNLYWAFLAQLVEQALRKRQVVGSTPADGSKQHLQMVEYLYGKN